LCAAVRFLYCVLKMSAAFDKNKVVRYVHWKILHSMRTLVMQLE